ncbi:Hypothetical protein CINCED_3A004976 [Cinara cedri]|uniref:Uncharacterized protein n=1 Tax=Cinara cedri TaxID=506608 RepID=A0A5E4N1S3_9HEMI|nr:Hypothetical protein CINCED_3A004976 [Cinara cedri]
MEKTISGTPTEIMSKLIWEESSLMKLARPITMVVNTMTAITTDRSGKESDDKRPPTENNDDWENSEGEYQDKLIIMVDKATLMPSQTIDSGVVETSRRSTRNSDGPSGASKTHRRLSWDPDGPSGVPESSRRANKESEKTAIFLKTSRRLTGDSSQENSSAKRPTHNNSCPSRVRILEKLVCENNEPAVPITHMIECAENLMAVLEQLRLDLPSTNENCDAVFDLINKVQWLLKDLGQTSGSSDQSRILMENYDNYRKAYYALQNHLAHIEQLTDQCGITRRPREVNAEKAIVRLPEEGSSGKNENSGDICCVVMLENAKSNRNFKGLCKCPGLLDLTYSNKNKDVKVPVKSTRPVKDDAKIFDWKSLIRTVCNLCFPCKLFCPMK